MVAFVGWRAWTSTERGLRAWHDLLLGIPIAGSIRRSAAAARGLTAMASLLESGVAISTALLYAAQATGDAELAARLARARGEILTGERVSAAVARHDALTRTAVRLIRAGEESGRLPQMLQHAGKIEGVRAEQGLRRAVRLLEPALVIVFGGVVALVAAALLQAVYSVRPVA
jgi:general secretion pathway protein F